MHQSWYVSIERSRASTTCVDHLPQAATCQDSLHSGPRYLDSFFRPSYPLMGVWMTGVQRCKILMMSASQAPIVGR
ncbi:hypothetical protein BAUCODRAFT_38402 [Baudoinia panamericana UAMH 10762]|uniref:Uncharacterized protein n=1 Tax=Baudoinia panamericana (strain UAMH 10762) TaxID=717646 RepID=M2M7P7_BAUPA|nr:uncharacterized protein BAUCODRAFT_38402 [Baudoinia panamericana UAMH 10762]EMC92351.1 hypothetical protein BAUCODRAFT_38402 [Baudoinia panamericana UAMH 10762]